MNVENAIVTKDFIEDVIKSINYNELIVKYFVNFSNEQQFLKSSGNVFKYHPETLNNNAINISLCNSFWQLDKYEVQKIKDFRKTNLCRSKFCSNCKKVKQASRMSKYIPELEQYKDNLYHLVLTSPNVDGNGLKDKLKTMSKAFRGLIEIIRGDRVINGLDFSRWGYKGAIRSLEVTFKEDNYHPHYHIALALNNDFLGKKDLINTFSYNFKGEITELTRLFSNEEILIQKLWYLLVNNERVTKNSLDSLDLGYSCIIDKFNENDYFEIFKYMTKEMNENGQALTYDNFTTLYESLYRVKQIQGYGCFYSITDDGDIESMEEKYEELINSLKEKEVPKVSIETPKELLKDNEYLLISRKKYFAYLQSIN